MNSTTALRSIARVTAIIAVTLAGTVVIAGCGAQGDDEATASAAQQAAETDTGAGQSVAAEDPAGDGASEESGDQPAAEEDAWIEAYAYAFTEVMGSEIEWDVDGTIIEFVFPSGAVGSNSSYHCLIGVSSFGTEHPGWDLKMTYPDGSVLCSEVES